MGADGTHAQAVSPHTHTRALVLGLVPELLGGPEEGSGSGSTEVPAEEQLISPLSPSFLAVVWETSLQRKGPTGPEQNLPSPSHVKPRYEAAA